MGEKASFESPCNVMILAAEHVKDIQGLLDALGGVMDYDLLLFEKLFDGCEVITLPVFNVFLLVEDVARVDHAAGHVVQNWNTIYPGLLRMHKRLMELGFDKLLKELR